MTEFNLSEKRAELFQFYLKKRTQFERFLIKEIYKDVIKQDKEFIRLLKEEAIWSVWNDIRDTYIDSGTIWKDHIDLMIEKIDNLAGDNIK